MSTGGNAYTKPPLDLVDQVALLQSRGLVVRDAVMAAEILRRVSYYRFVGFGLPFEEWGVDGERLDSYIPGTAFEDIVAVYDFDIALRLLLWKYIEPVEVAFRTAVCYEMSTTTGDPFWFLDDAYFLGTNEHHDFLELCQKEFDRDKPEVFIKCFKSNYARMQLPPCWMLIEIVPFGAWSKAFSKLKHQNYRKQIANHFKTHPKLLQSWIHTVLVVRNICAHHLRIWNRIFPIPPEITLKMRPYIDNHQRIAAPIFALRELLEPIGRTGDFDTEFHALLDSSPFIDQAELGLVT